MRVLYIDIDSLRPDHLGCYGYHRATSPNIDSVAAEGVRFTNYYAPDTPCLPSRTALFSGQFGIHTGVVNHGGIRADLRPQGAGRDFRSVHCVNALAEVLRNAGCYTAQISPFPHRHTAYQTMYGFHEAFDTGSNGHEGAHVVWPYVERWIDANRARPNWFLHVNVWDPHAPYDVPTEYGEPFKDDPPPAWLTQEIIDRQRASYGPHDASVPHGNYSLDFNWPRGADSIRNVNDWKKWMDGYDTGIHYADYYVGKMIAKLKALNLYDDTAIIISADHGENHGELNVYGDHQTADQICNNVPLVVKWPGVTSGKGGRVFTGLHYNVDLAATFCELLNGKQPQAWDGKSFAETLRSGADQGRPFLVLSHGAWSCQRSVRWGEHILIRTYHTGHKDFPALMLFNLKTDPHEQHNLAATHPQLVGEGLRLMDGWVAEQLQRSGHPDPLFDVIAEGGPLHANRRNLPALCECLRKTGREQHAQWLEIHDGQPHER
jgi:choline-sulfatase